MTSVALKKYLYSKINLIDDDLVLEKIKKVVAKNEKVYVLSEAQLKNIEISEQQILRGECIDEEEMDKKFEEWLNAE
jgi:hypothetical protein